MTSVEAGPCLDDDADMLQDLGIGFVARALPAAPANCSPRRSAAVQPAVASPAPSVVDLLSDSDMAPSPTARDAAACPELSLHSPPQQQAAPMQRDSTAAAGAVRSPSVNRLLADMVDLLSGSDDEADAALAAALATAGDCDAAMAAGSPQASPLRRKSSSRRIRKPARFKDTDAELASPPARQSAQLSDGRAGDGPTAWPSPPEDSFIDDEPAISVPADIDDATDPSPQQKRCGPWTSQTYLTTAQNTPWTLSPKRSIRIRRALTGVLMPAGGKRIRRRPQQTITRKRCSAR